MGALRRRKHAAAARPTGAALESAPGHAVAARRFRRRGGPAQIVAADARSRTTRSATLRWTVVTEDEDHGVRQHRQQLHRVELRPVRRAEECFDTPAC